jgi:hypothetical protein
MVVEYGAAGASGFGGGAVVEVSVVVVEKQVVL